MAEPPPLVSRRELRLRYSIPIVRTSPFWEALKQRRLVTTKCRACGAIHFPPQIDCSKCMSSDAEWIPLSGEATLESFTQINVTPVSFVDEDPYVVAVGRLREGFNVLAWIRGVRPDQLRIGMKLRLVAREDEGRGVYEFVPEQT